MMNRPEITDTLFVALDACVPGSFVDSEGYIVTPEGSPTGGDYVDTDPPDSYITSATNTGNIAIIPDVSESPPDPILGDVIRMQGEGDIKHSRGMTPNIIKSKKEFYTFVITYTGLTESQMDSFRTFLTNNLGLEVDYVDVRSNVWRCIITTPDAPIVKNGVNNYSLSMQLEGVLQHASG